MAESAQSNDLFWVDPEKRGIIPLDGFHISKSLKKFILRQQFQFSVNSQFDAVLSNCGDRHETWINPQISDLYSRLHRMGFVHSIEVFSNEKLIGGLYGVCIGGAFFGESMFSKTTNGSKLALISLLARLNVGGFKLLDTQFITPHLISMGAIEISRTKYHEHLENALATEADFFKLPENYSDAHSLLQFSTQTS